MAIVTGAARGIGEQAAIKLTAAGARVMISDVDADAVRADADGLPGDATVHAGDLTAEDACVLPVSGGLLGGMFQ